MAKIAIVGLGRVGLATGVALATLGHEVTGFDVDATKIKLIRSGKQPFFEKGLTEALRKVTKTGKFAATDDPEKGLAKATFCFICVGTPQLLDGSMDPSYLRGASSLIGKTIASREDYPVVVVKSTIVPGTTENVVLPAIRESSRLVFDSFGVCVNPEFLREGTMMEDTLKPDRIVIGSDSKRAGDLLAKLYSRFKCVKWRCDTTTAEMVKYATNAFLATKVTFANEIANICGLFGIDSDRVLEGMALDPRIEQKYLVPGAGFGGSCLPKDVKAVAAEARRRGYEPSLLRTVLSFNDHQAIRVVDILEKELGTLEGRRVALLGLAFKPETDDTRDSRAITIIEELVRRRANVVVHDPAASIEGLGAGLGMTTAPTAREALRGSDGCIIQAGWDQYRRLGRADFALMRRAVVVDGRRTLNRDKLPKGIVYRRIG